MLPVFLLRAGRGVMRLCFAKLAFHHDVIRASRPRPGPRALLSQTRRELASHGGNATGLPGEARRGALRRQGPPIASVSIQKAPLAKRTL